MLRVGDELSSRARIFRVVDGVWWWSIGGPEWNESGVWDWKVERGVYCDDVGGVQMTSMRRVENGKRGSWEVVIDVELEWGKGEWVLNSLRYGVTY